MSVLGREVFIKKNPFDEVKICTFASFNNFLALNRVFPFFLEMNLAVMEGGISCL